MDITTGAAGSADLLRAYLGAGPITEDTTLQTCWDVAVDATQRWIRPGYSADAPAGVQEFVLSVAAVVYRHRDSGGDSTILPDGTFTTGNYLTHGKIRTLAAAYGGPYTVSPRVIA